MTISFYNAADQLTATTDPLGNTTIYAYTSGVAGVPNGLQYCSVDPVDYQNSVDLPRLRRRPCDRHRHGHFRRGRRQARPRPTPTATPPRYVYGAPGHPGLVSSMTDPDGTIDHLHLQRGRASVTATVVTFGSYSATTLYAYDSAGPPVLRGRPVRDRQRGHLPVVAAVLAADPRQRPLPRGHDHQLRRRRPGRADHQPARRHHLHRLRRRRRVVLHRRAQRRPHQASPARRRRRRHRRPSAATPTWGRRSPPTTPTAGSCRSPTRWAGSP